jgi:LmbE family N-acetylglucosaminyl deacetylase
MISMPRRLPHRAALVVALLVATAGAFRPVSAQDPANAPALIQGGVSELALQLRKLDGVKRVLMIGAHPDDEDTSLLTALSRGMGVETAYLSLTRGDGGQNLIGPELFEGLGVVRTGELLAARRLDGGAQFFTRAFDFGFSKSADEALALWPRDELLRDVTWVVRTFRPHVIVSVFSGTPRDGHGQHQAAGIIARAVFDVAGDPSQFADQMERGVAPWQPLKLYQRVRGEPTGAVVEVPTGQWDPVLGRSWFQVAMASRSQHRSQDMGQGQSLGARGSRITLWQTASGSPDGAAGPLASADLFAGIDTTLTGAAAALENGASGAEGHLEAYRAELAAARGGLVLERPWGIVPALGRALGHLEAALEPFETAAGRSPASSAGEQRHAYLDLRARRNRLAEALVAASGVQVRVAADDDIVVPGDAFEVTLEVWNGGEFTIAAEELELTTPEGWTVEVEGDGEGEARRGAEAGESPGGEAEGSTHLAPGELVRRTYRVTVPDGADVSRLFFRAQPRDGEMYRWPDAPELWAQPFDAPPVGAGVQLVVETPDGPVRVPRVEAAARFVGVDKAIGEFTRPLLVVPAVSVASRPATMLWPLELDEAREVSVEVRAEDAQGVQGVLRLEVPEGWQVEPSGIPFSFAAPGEGRAFSFQVRRGNAAAGRHDFVPVVELDDGRSYREGYRLIEYPHVDRVAFFESAATRVSVASVQAPHGLRVGYVMGSGDDGPGALRQMGIDVEAIDAARLQRGDLDGLDALVLGIRVYETQPEIAASNEAILDFARSGGTVVVQYNKYEYPEGGFAPYPISMRPRAPRVTDERSPVRILDSSSPIFDGPNRLTSNDFDGWVQERGLYFLSEWDERFVPQIAFTDPGEDEALGSLLVAPVGEGLYVYTGISFFRQFPAGVSGAYRLFANLISLDRAGWDAWRAVSGTD